MNNCHRPTRRSVIGHRWSFVATSHSRADSRRATERSRRSAARASTAERAGTTLRLHALRAASTTRSSVVVTPSLASSTTVVLSTSADGFARASLERTPRSAAALRASANRTARSSSVPTCKSRVPCALSRGSVTRIAVASVKRPAADAASSSERQHDHRLAGGGKGGTMKRLLPIRVLRAWWRVRPYWHCRHCGAQVHSFRLRGKRHWAHLHGEAHCEAPCPLFRPCRCSWACWACDEPLPDKPRGFCPTCEALQ